MVGRISRCVSDLVPFWIIEYNFYPVLHNPVARAYANHLFINYFWPTLKPVWGIFYIQIQYLKKKPLNIALWIQYKIWAHSNLIVN